MDINLKQLEQILDAFENRKMQKLEIKQGDFEIYLERDVEHVANVVHAPAVHHSHPPHHHHPHPPKGEHPHPPKEAESASGVFITSPMVGTFYASPAPEEPAFVKVGDKVEKGQVVCIVEAMKVMNEVKATESGTVQEICVENGHPVEFGTKIIRVG